jgi:cytochrome c-type biogenesis protein CcmH
MTPVRRLCLALAVLCLSALHAFAVQPDEVLSDPALETRARALSAELRCLVCQNQSIDDSDAPLARDLRILIRERLKAGDTDAAAIDFLVERYGEFVLLRPRIAPHTLVLWLGPFLILALAVWAAVRRRRAAGGAAPAEQPLSEEESRRLAELMNRRA